jgi:hypothetical protein
MSKKRPIKKIFESTSIESADAEPNLTESVQGEQAGEATPPVANSQEEEPETSSSDEGVAGEKSLLSDEKKDEGTESVSVDLQNQETASNPPQEGMETPSAEALLEDVRQSLIEEEIDKQKKDSKWWRRIGRKGKRVEPDQPSENVEIDLPATIISAGVVEDHAQEPGVGGGCG